MSKTEIIYSGILVFGVLISSFSQILLKKSAQKKHSSFIKEYLNPCVIIAYAIFFAATFLSIYAYKVVPLSLGPILDSSGGFFITILGLIFLKEKITVKKAIALAIIILGIIIYSI